MEFVVSFLNQKYRGNIVGPSEPGISRVRNMYIMECMLKLPPNSKALSDCKAYIRAAIIEMLTHEAFKRVWITADADAI